MVSRTNKLAAKQGSKGVRGQLELEQIVVVAGARNQLLLLFQAFDVRAVPGIRLVA